MGDLNDFQGFRREFERERERLEQADIDDRDREAIEEFIRRKGRERQPGGESVKISTLKEYAKTLRVCATRVETPIVEMDVDDLYLFEEDLRTNPDYGRGGPLSPRTVVGHLSTLKLLWEGLGKEWPDGMTTTPPRRKVDPREMINSEDIEAMTDAAWRLRDVALIEFLADTGARLSLVGSLRVCDLDLDVERPSYTPNPNALGLKGADIKPYPVIDSAAILRSYISATHPRPNDGECALFHRLDEPGVDAFDGDGALSAGQISRRLKKIAEKAGVEKPVNPHNWRHSAITRMYREGYTAQQIEHRVHWSIDSGQWDTYVHLLAEDMNETIFADAGLVDEDGADRMARSRCGNCLESLAPHHHHCPRCGKVATHEAREVQEGAIEETGHRMMTTEEVIRREVQQQMMRLGLSGRVQVPVPDDLESHD
jgi:integrase/recombinase XerD